MLFQIVEDDPILARSLQLNLELEGHKVIHHTHLKMAVDYFKIAKPDFIILDLGLPDGSGLEYLEFVRQTAPDIPLIILSAQSDEDSVVKGLMLGAHDFVKKPYSFKELYARVQVVGRKKIEKSEIYEFADIKANLKERIIKFNNQTIEMNRREFDIFSYFMRNAERIVSRESLIQFLDKDSEIFDRTIDSHVSHIRKALKEAQILHVKISSVYGLGYRLEKNDTK